jgi:hypothetical protein
VKTMSMVAAICLVGCLLAIGAFWRSERVRSAYRIRALSDGLSHARNENEWLRGDIERKKNPSLLSIALKKKGAEALVKDVPVVTVVPRAHLEVPGS